MLTERQIPVLTIQLYTLRTQLRMDFEGTIRTLSQIGFPCVEPAGFPGSTPTRTAEILNRYGLLAPTAHCPLPVGERTNEVIETALELGHKYLITAVPPYGIPNFSQMDGLKAAAELYCQAAANAHAHGLMVGYHNHAKDLGMIDGRPSYQYFLELTPENVLWEADLFWVAKAGLDPVEFVRDIGSRGRVLHFKDGLVDAPSVMIPYQAAGAGEVDLLAAAEAAVAAEYVGVELDDYDGNIWGAIQDSYDYLTAHHIAVGKR